MAGCGISGVQYVLREDEDTLSGGSLVSKTCKRGLDPCPDEEYATGQGWGTTYFYLRVSNMYDSRQRWSSVIDLLPTCQVVTV